MRRGNLTLLMAVLTLIGPVLCLSGRLEAETTARITLSGAHLPPVPGPFSAAGAAGNALILAGGNSAWVLIPGSPWRQFHLDTGISSGRSVSTGDGLICISGASVSRLRWTDNQLHQEALPDLRSSISDAGAAILNSTLYVVDGATNSFFALDLSATSPHWQTLDPLPGPPCLHPIVVGQYYTVEVFGPTSYGFRPRPLDGTTTRGWVRLADPPQPISSGTAIPTGQSHTLLAGQAVLSYDAVTDTWTQLAGSAPTAATAVQWQDHLLFLSPNSAISELTIIPAIKRLPWIDYAIVGVYFAAVSGIGIYFSRRQNSTEEFALGGRKTRWWVAALSLYATTTSSISLMAIPALNYSTNLVWLLTPLLTVLALAPQAFIVIPLLRRLNITSTYEYLEKRFNPALRRLASLQCIIFYTIGRASIVILLPSIAISAVSGLSVWTCVLLIGLLTTLYTSLGGLDAVIWSDVLQAGVMLLVPVVILFTVISGLPHGIHDFVATGSQFGKFNLAIFSWDLTEPVAFISLATVLLSLSGFAGEQAMVQRVLATPDDRAARKATLGNWAVCVGGAILVQLMGVSLFVYFHSHPNLLSPTMRNDQVVPLFVVQVLPVGVAGLIIAGLFAGSMSFFAGTVNSVATLVVQDFYKPWRPDASDHNRLRLLKLLSYAVGLIGTAIAAGMAEMKVRSLMETWTTLASLCGAGFAGVYTLGIFSRRATGAGAFIGACSSVVITAAVWKFTAFHWTLYLPLAIFSCIVIGYAASLLTPAPRRDLRGLTAFTAHSRAMDRSALTLITLAATQ